MDTRLKLRLGNHLSKGMTGKVSKLATKMPMRDFNSLEDMERIFAEQLEKLWR